MNVKFRLIRMLCIPLVLLIAATSCQHMRCSPTPIQDSVKPRVFEPNSLSAIQRIALVPFENGTGIRGIESQMQNQIASALNSCAQRSAIDLIPPNDQVCDIDSVLRGEYPIHLLANAWRNYHADAVMFARVHHYSSYPPLSLGITIHVVDARDARLLVTVNQIWSLADANVLAAYRDWLSRRLPGSPGVDVYLTSPTMFGEFVASEAVKAFQ